MRGARAFPSPRRLGEGSGVRGLDSRQRRPTVTPRTDAHRQGLGLLLADGTAACRSHRGERPPSRRTSRGLNYRAMSRGLCAMARIRGRHARRWTTTAARIRGRFLRERRPLASATSAPRFRNRNRRPPRSSTRSSCASSFAVSSLTSGASADFAREGHRLGRDGRGVARRRVAS